MTRSDPAQKRFGRRLLWIAVGVMAVYTVVGFFVVPPIVKSQLQQRLGTELGRVVTVEKVRFNPYALSLTLEGFHVRAADGSSQFVAWDRLYVNFEALASLRKAWVLREVSLIGFTADVAVAADGTLNFSDIMTKLTQSDAEPKPESTKPPRPVRIDALSVGGARVFFADASRSAPFQTEIGPLTFVVNDFYTAPGDANAPYRFEATTETGERLTWMGTLGAVPFRSTGELSLENISLAKYAPYYAENFHGELASGTVSVRGRYEIDLSETNRVMKLTDTSVQLRNVKVMEKGTQQAALELPMLDVNGIQADAEASKFAVDSLRIAGGAARVRREESGALNLLAMVLPADSKRSGQSEPAVTSGPTAAAERPELQVGEVAVSDFRVEWEDRAAARVVQLPIEQLQFSLKDITLADGAMMPLSVNLTFANEGKVEVSGTVGVFPQVKADVQVAVNTFAILPLSPYVEEFVNARITQGKVTTTLAITADLPEGSPLAITAAGALTVNQFGLVDAAMNQELAGFGSFALTQLQISTAPKLTVSIAEVMVAAPYARIAMSKDGQLNLAGLAKTSEANSAGDRETTSETPAQLAEEPKGSEPEIKIGKVVIADGDFSLTDNSVEPHVQVALSKFGGTISELSSDQLAKGAVDLQGVIDGAGPVAITGKLDPLGAEKHIALKVDFKNVDLVPVSPYSGKYAGFELARGKLQLEVNFNMEGSKINSENVVTLNQFTFGNAVQSPDATTLPVRLGVALLKDSSGKIVIDIPIQGDLQDPEFKIGRVVMRVITNLLVKVATSPFSLLGSMFGGGGEELAYQEFSVGSATLQEAELPKLETMVKALQNRPALSVALEGSFDREADSFSLKSAKLSDQVRRAIWEEKRAKDPSIAPPEKLEITPEENVAMVKKLFDAKFPPGTEFGTPLPKAPEVVAPPAPPKPGLLKRIANVVTLKGLREKRHSEQADMEAEAAHAAAVAAAEKVGLPLEDMMGRLEEAIVITDDDLQALATARAQRVRDYLVETGKIDGERVFLAKTATNVAEGKGPRVFLNLQ